jgi:hypothetical protein
MRFPLRGEGCNTPALNSSKLVLIMCVIMSLNQVWNKLNQILFEFKGQNLIQFFHLNSIDFFVKVANKKLVPNIPIYP